MIEVRRIPETCLIEIRVLSEKAEEATRLANALGETYLNHRRDHPATSPQGPAAIEVEVLDHAVPAASPMWHYELAQLASYALAGLCLAFAVGGKVMWGVAEVSGRRARPSEMENPLTEHGSIR
jgi:capsular polysaccharide biosynthesis protein